MLISRKPCQIERFRRNFWPTGYVWRVAMPIFKKKFFSQKMAAILNFRIFRKIAKHKNAYISKTMLDRAISTKFLTHRVSLKSRHGNFQKKICLAKNGGHFEFSNFCVKIAKHKNANILKTVLQRMISTKFFIFRVSLQSSYPKELSLGEISDP